MVFGSKYKGKGSNLLPDGIIPSMGPEKVVYIGVHPYSELGTYEHDKTFVAARNNRLKNRSIEQILFLEKKAYPKAIFKFGLYLPYWRGRVFMTEESYPTPLNSSFEEMSKIIVSHFPADVYKFWGAELSIDHNGEPIFGCVYGAFVHFQLPNKQIDVESCWVEEE